MQNKDYGATPSYGSQGTSYAPAETHIEPETSVTDSQQTAVTSMAKSTMTLGSNVGANSQHLNPSTHESPTKRDIKNENNKPRSQ